MNLLSYSYLSARFASTCLRKIITMQNKIIFICIIIILFEISELTSAMVVEKGINGKPLPKAATFHFPEYAYKETSKNEITYHEFELACEQQEPCANMLPSAAKKSCVRRCISPSCYQDIYAFDELEEGEIDVRMNSFKGCVIQRTGSNRRMKASLFDKVLVFGV